MLPEYIQSEGIDGLLGNLSRIGANAVATSPYLMEEADPETGQREPPVDANAGSVRLLDRPLFGKREVYVKTAPSFVPDLSLYSGLRYQPSEPTELTRREGHLLSDFIGTAKARGFRVYFQVQAAIPPGYRVQFGGPVESDRARLPDGSIPARRLAKNGSLASPHILGYEHALIRDLIRNYPDLDGLRVDWPEYPPYFLDSAFLDFSYHAEKAAERMGFPFDRMRRDVGRLYSKLHGGLADSDLEPWAEDADGGRYHLLRLLSDYPGVSAWLRFKAALVEEMIGGFRRTMDESGAESMELLPNAFPPPWTIVSGMDFRRVARHSSATSCYKRIRDSRVACLRERWCGGWTSPTTTAWRQSRTTRTPLRTSRIRWAPEPRPGRSARRNAMPVTLPFMSWRTATVLWMTSAKGW